MNAIYRAKKGCNINPTKIGHKKNSMANIWTIKIPTGLLNRPCLLPNFEKYNSKIWSLAFVFLGTSSWAIDWLHFFSSREFWIFTGYCVPDVTDVTSSVLIIVGQHWPNMGVDKADEDFWGGDSHAVPRVKTQKEKKYPGNVEILEIQNPKSETLVDQKQQKRICSKNLGEVWKKKLILMNIKMNQLKRKMVKCEQLPNKSHKPLGPFILDPLLESWGFSKNKKKQKEMKNITHEMLKVAASTGVWATEFSTELELPPPTGSGRQFCPWEKGPRHRFYYEPGIWNAGSVLHSWRCTRGCWICGSSVKTKVGFSGHAGTSSQIDDLEIPGVQNTVQKLGLAQFKEIHGIRIQCSMVGFCNHCWSSDDMGCQSRGDLVPENSKNLEIRSWSSEFGEYQISIHFQFSGPKLILGGLSTEGWWRQFCPDFESPKTQL